MRYVDSFSQHPIKLSVCKPTFDCSRRRTATAIQRTYGWLDELLEAGLPSSAIAVPIVAANGDLAIPAKFRNEAELQSFAAVWIANTGLSETGGERLQAVSTVVQQIPADLVRCISRTTTLHDIVALVAVGVDVFDTDYVAELTAMHQALSVDRATGLPTVESVLDPLLLEQAGPLTAECTCFACSKHSRAYVHHLTSAHEILGSTLLALHNQRQLEVFFEVVRDTIRNGTFDDMKAAFGVTK